MRKWEHGRWRVVWERVGLFGNSAIDPQQDEA